MKKFIIIALTVLLCCAPLCACSTDFSAQINEGMDNLYASLYETFELFFKRAEEDAEIGTEVGNKLPSYSVQVFDENGLKDEFVDPSSLGKVTVINFWGTWCPYCIDELPEFSEVATEYKDDVTIIAIHSVERFSDSAVSYVKNNLESSDIVFAKDVNLGEGNVYHDECYEAFGGKGYYPYTVILDENGVITYKTDGAISKGVLTARIEEALGKQNDAE